MHQIAWLHACTRISDCIGYFPFYVLVRIQIWYQNLLHSRIGFKLPILNEIVQAFKILNYVIKMLKFAFNNLIRWKEKKYGSADQHVVGWEPVLLEVWGSAASLGRDYLVLSGLADTKTALGPRIGMFRPNYTSRFRLLQCLRYGHF
jgi:hypothetical protein